MKQKNYPLYETTVFENFRVLTENAAAKFPQDPALIYRLHPQDPTPITKTFTQLRDDCRDLGTGLIALGLRDHHCAIIGGSTYGWVISYFALMSIGAVTVPLDQELPAVQMAQTLRAAGCSCIVYSAAMERKIREVRDLLADDNILYICMMGTSTLADTKNLDDILADGSERYAKGDQSYYDYDIDTQRMATIVYTSGTTGKGKGVMLSQKNIVSDMTQGMYNFAITRKNMCVLPPHHTFCSTVNFVGHLAQGACLYLSSGLRYILSELKEQQPTHLVLVPLFVETFYKKIWQTAEKTGKDKLLRRMMHVSNGMRRVGIDVRRQLFKSVTSAFGGKLEMIICGGAALPQKVIDTFDALGITILNGYGITECSPLISCNRNRWQKQGSVGVPIIGEEVKIADPDANGEGEICVKGPNVMLGYYKDPAATAAAFDDEGFFKTGDYGRLDEDGWIYITGRLKNLIIFSNGKNVYPEEIETEISGVRGVKECVVYAGESKSDPQKEIIVAEIYPDEEELREHGITDFQSYFEHAVDEINRRSVSYKRVGLVKLRDTEFEKNTSKKIIRFLIDRTID